MRRVTTAAISLVIILLVVSGVAVAGKQPTVAGGRLEFRLPDLSGTDVGSDDERFAGRVVLVTLWATWCPPCLTEIPTLNALQAEFGERGLVVVGIAFEAETDAVKRREALREFGETQEISYLVLDGGTPDEFSLALPSLDNIRGFPVEILIGRDGAVSVARNGFGYKKKWAAKLRREIETMLEASD